jgi:uncharacterized protein YxeA
MKHILLVINVVMLSVMVFQYAIIREKNDKIDRKNSYISDMNRNYEKLSRTAYDLKSELEYVNLASGKDMPHP